MEDKIVLDAEIKYNLELSGAEMVLIINAISKLPYSEISSTIESIKKQVIKK